MPKRLIAPLVNGRVRLRLIEEADLPMTLAWRNRDDIRPWFLTTDVISADQHRGWYEQYADRDDDFVFIIEETEAFRRPVGQISIYAIDWKAGHEKFGRLMIGDLAARRLGLARLATSRLVDEVCHAWHLREVFLESRVDNSPALAVYETCGFRAVGYVTEDVMIMRRDAPSGRS